MKICLITDTHFGARNDNLIFNDYFFKFYDEVFFPYLIENNIKTIIHLGDIVDRRKYVNYFILYQMRKRFFDPLRDQNIDCHYLIGNHDTPFKNSSDINSMYELFGDRRGRRFTSYVIAQDVEFDGLQICLVPWINDSNAVTTFETIKKTKADILFGHLEIKGFQMYRGILNDQGLDREMFNKFQLVCSGHFHHRSISDNITYLGSPYEMTWGDYGDSRGFHIFDTDTRELKFIENPNKMFHKVVYDDENKSSDEVLNVDFSKYAGTTLKIITEKKTNLVLFDQFINNIYEVNPNHVQIIESNMLKEFLDEDEIINEAEDTLTIIQKYIEKNVEEGVDKKKLNKLMNSLYNESLAMEI